MKNKKGAATPEGTPASEEIAASATPEGAQDDAQEQPVGTTDTLFPGHNTAEEAVEPAAEDSSSVDEVVDETPEKTVEPANPTAEISGDRMVKTVIDGVEKEIPYSEVLKGYQTSNHLYSESLKLGEERKSLETLKAEIIDAAKQPGAPEPTVEDIDPEGVYVDPAVIALRDQVKTLTELVTSQGKNIADTSKVTAPIAYQNSLKSLDANLIAQGHTDFMDYVPRIEEAIALLPEESRKQAYSEDFFSHEFAMMKLKDMANPVKEVIAPVNADARPDPKVVPIESANSSGSQVDDSEAAYNKAKELAKETGDWSKVFKMKKIVGFEH
jgi:hypothetical protein